MDNGSTSKLHHRRQASRGLEINTDLSKTNAFFNTSNIPTPRPPPSITRKISIKQNNTHTPIVDYEETATPNHHESYANRLRNLVAATRQASVAPAPAPIPQYLSMKKPETEEPSPTITSFSEDEIMALPTPRPSNSGEIKKKLPLAKKPEELPVIMSCLSPSISNETPSLSDEPMLGDYVEPIKREQQYKYSTKISHVMDEEIIGKQIGSFRISKLLGVGAFSKVYVGHHQEKDQFYAVKTIQKGKVLNDPRVRSSIEREIGILKYINHPNIVHLEATMETEHIMCIVLEYVEGGELFDFVQKMHYQSRLSQQKVNESTIKHLFLQLVKAVKWLHEHHIVHRDLKLENILIHREQDDQIILKITDFGLARVVDPESPLLTTRCGSEEYAAPEIVQSKGYDGRKTDVWALGIILYALLVGYLPFRYDPGKQERVSQLFYRIVKAEVKWPTDELSEISQEAKYVVSKILERDPDKRIHINDIEHLPWFNL
ncbi:Pkinase-domain-containing protein [Rhizopus microsporus var. microsporus]|uniref:non-specific serine/threonine protein kinase n=2 Tax=Rhizopus microsporus TaxID=58291 RepID=A0A2G4T2Z6_RHIZD|nr:Pkinase-domain-containing protein [Rhizopus microsporus ATCC 52813]ORE02854.1 Pkinase-domain-containing protein [Rhizopus microsporus var. microsporus]PHZ15374.1 Pkinase-domain-containing protein [Rhizopus microsporus ATCC 52813]